MDATLQELKRAHLAGDATATAQYIAMLERAAGGVEPFPPVELNKSQYHFGQRCLDCGTIILSLDRHAFIVCECWDSGHGDGPPKGCAVDGGFDYCKVAAADSSCVQPVAIKIRNRGTT